MIINTSSMPKVRYLCVRFSNPIFPYDIPFFRSAVIEKTDRVASLFHNHKDDKTVIYRYPLIQYKITRGKASIICLNNGVQDIHHLLKHPSLDLRIGNRELSFMVEDIDLHSHEAKINDSLIEYNLSNWLALNQKHHHRFQELEGDDAKQLDLLQSILRGNILAFAKGIDWFIEDKVIAQITKVKNVRPLLFKRKEVMTFNLNFQTNVSLPDFVGLGKSSSIGFGVVKQIFKRIES